MRNIWRNVSKSIILILGLLYERAVLADPAGGSPRIHRWGSTYLSLSLVSCLGERLTPLRRRGPARDCTPIHAENQHRDVPASRGVARLDEEEDGKLGSQHFEHEAFVDSEWYIEVRSRRRFSGLCAPPEGLGVCWVVGVGCLGRVSFEEVPRSWWMAFSGMSLVGHKETDVRDGIDPSFGGPGVVYFPRGEIGI